MPKATIDTSLEHPAPLLFPIEIALKKKKKKCCKKYKKKGKRCGSCPLAGCA